MPIVSRETIYPLILRSDKDTFPDNVSRETLLPDRFFKRSILYQVSQTAAAGYEFSLGSILYIIVFCENFDIAPECFTWNIPIDVSQQPETEISFIFFCPDSINSHDPINDSIIVSRETMMTILFFSSFSFLNVSRETNLVFPFAFISKCVLDRLAEKFRPLAEKILTKSQVRFMSRQTFDPMLNNPDWKAPFSKWTLPLLRSNEPFCL